MPVLTLDIGTDPGFDGGDDEGEVDASSGSGYRLASCGNAPAHPESIALVVGVSVFA